MHNVYLMQNAECGIEYYFVGTRRAVSEMN